MGYYIETDSTKGKANWLIKNAGAIDVPGPFQGDSSRIPVVVVDNGRFEAAAIAYSKSELAAFSSHDDPRPKRWLSVPRSEVIRLNPYVKDELAW